jgi:hypothetical protein
MARRITLLSLFALVMLSGPGCCYMRSCFNQFRANHPCLFPCYNSAYPGGCGSCGTCGGGAAPAAYDGCATCYSGSPSVGQPYPAAIFGPPQPITGTTAPDPKAGIPNPMK